MSERSLKRLVGALAVVVLLWLVASLFSGDDGSIGASGDIASFFDGVGESSVTAVRIVRPDGTIELRPMGDSWSVNGFRADSGSVARFFQAIPELEVGDLAASNPANHERMGVSADSARSLELEVGDSIRTLLVGREGPRASTAYVRLPGEDDVYLLQGNIRSHLTRQLDDWRNRKLVAIDTSRVRRLEVERDGEAYALVRADSVWTFEDGSEVNTTPVRNILGELGGGLVAPGFVHDDDPLAATAPGGSTAAYSETGEALAEVTISGGTGDRWATVVGDSVRYRLAPFRVDLITPTLGSVRPGG